MIRLTVNPQFSTNIRPKLTVAIVEGNPGNYDINGDALALIEAPVTPELVDALRAASKAASEALEAYDLAKAGAA